MSVCKHTITRTRTQALSICHTFFTSPRIIIVRFRRKSFLRLQRIEHV